MTRERDATFDDRIADWLEEDPTTAPRQLLETVIAAVPSIPQRVSRPAWRAGTTGTAWPLALAAALIAAIGLVGLSLLRGPSVGPGPSPTPSPTAAFGLTGTWVKFTSPQYGYSIDRPLPWTVREATNALVEAGAPWIDSGGVDYVAAEPVGSAYPGIITAAAELSPGRTLAAWTDLTTVATCGPPASQESISIDGETGILLEYPACNGAHHLWATVVHGTTGYHIVWIGSPGTEAADRAVFDQAVASFRFPPAASASASPTPTGEPLPDGFIGAWYHSAPAWMWFIRAGDPACVTLARTELDCAIWQPVGKPREVGAATIEDGALSVAWRSGFCTGVRSRYTFGLRGDALGLVERPGGCDGGDFPLTRAGTGTAPTAPPQPAP